MKKKLCLITEIPSHYRKLIYQKMENELGCDFIFGDTDGSIKRIDSRELRNIVNVKVKHWDHSNLFRVKGVMRYLSQYEVIIDDLGIFCLTSWYILIKAKFSRQKVYHWDHGWYGREGFVKKWIKRLYFGLADGAFIYGNRAIKLMKENGFNGTKLFPIHNSLDYDSQLKIRLQLSKSNIYNSHFGNDYPVIIFIGRLTPVKKLDMLIDSIAILKERNQNYNLVLVGNGNLLTFLEQHAINRGIQNYVWFYGACYDERVNAELIYNADLCVAPGNIGLTAMHAMTYGCPCISHNNFSRQMPEFEAIKEDVTGAFFESGNVNSLADSISNWFTHKTNKRKEVRQSCYKEIDKNWNPNYQMEILKQVIG